MSTLPSFGLRLPGAFPGPGRVSQQNRALSGGWVAPLPGDVFVLRRPWFGSSAPDSRKRVLAIADNFDDKDFPLLYLNRDGEKKPAKLTSHGEMVAAYARMVVPDIEIARYPVKRTAQGNLDLLPALQAIYADIRGGKPIDAINVSFAVSVPIQRLREDLLIPGLRAENVKDLRRFILARLHKLCIDRIENEEVRKRFGNAWQSALGNLRTQLYVLQELGRKCPLFLSAGNDGPGYLNLLSLARNVITVGALRPDGTKAHYSNDNQLVSRWERVGYPLIIRTAGKRVIGFDLNVPGREARNRPLPLPVHNLRVIDRTVRKHWGVLQQSDYELSLPYGTSLAAPQAAAKAAMSGKRLNLA